MSEKTKTELELLTNIGMLLMLEKGIGLEFVMLYIAMQKQIINS